MHCDTKNPDDDTSPRQWQTLSSVVTAAAAVPAAAVGWATIWSPNPEPSHPPSSTNTVILVPAHSGDRVGCGGAAEGVIRLAVRVTDSGVAQ
ncbi:hypothetical protein IU450_37635 [Nocardia abscessus]|uniref:hypothetical protein n=1 Tax=Nocardia abscessus TaxID=120957 RepID=UPI0018938D18|nr:hypothetical protein [Nocardia abscessus]MBF6341559.1 hypothetical protein [Nocardia abscessus]